MTRHRITAGIVAFAALGFAACAAEDDAPDAVLTDTVTQPGMETVQVPVTDTAIVQTEITIDTMIDTDTVVRETDVTAVPDTTPR